MVKLYGSGNCVGGICGFCIWEGDQKYKVFDLVVKIGGMDNKMREILGRLMGFGGGREGNAVLFRGYLHLFKV